MTFKSVKCTSYVFVAVVRYLKGTSYVFVAMVRCMAVAGVLMAGRPDTVSAQVYSPVILLNGSNAELDSADYSEAKPNSSVGAGLVAYWPAFANFSYRASAAMQMRKFNLISKTDDHKRRFLLSTLDVGVGIHTDFIDFIGAFIGVEATWLAKIECRGLSPCDDSGGGKIGAQFHAGFSMGPQWLKFEPYWEYLPFAPVKGTKSLTTYGVAIHFFPESFSAE